MEESVQKVWQMSVALLHWCSLPLGCVSQIVLLGGWIKDFGTVSFDDRNGFAEIVA